MSAPLSGMDFYSCSEDEEVLRHTTLDEAVEDYLDQTDPASEPATVTVYGFKRRVIPVDEHALDPERICEDILEMLDEEFGGDDEGATKPTPKMLELAGALAAAVRAEYEVWQCEQVGRVEVDLAAWRQEHGQ